MARRWMFVGALLVLVGGLAACSSDVAANDLEVGDCVETQAELTTADVEAVDCDESHEAEVFHVFDVEGDDFPGEAEISAEAEECIGDAFESYVGVPYLESEIEVFPLLPSEQSWNEADDRTIICFAVNADGSASEGSVEGADR